MLLLDIITDLGNSSADSKSIAPSDLYKTSPLFKA